MSRRGNYRLRPVEESDLERILEWRNSDRIRANMYTDHLISMTEHKTWYQNLMKEKTSRFMVFEYREKSVGVVNISQIDQKNNRCHWGFYLGEIGIVKRCGMALGYFGLDYIFGNLRMRKVYGEALAFNLASINFHEKLGFTEDNRITKHVFKSGRYEDIVSMGLNYEDWVKMKPELEELCFGSNCRS